MADKPAARVVVFNQAFKRRIISPPNLISVVRVVTIPFIYWCLKRSSDHLALILLGMALLSDAIDGFIARRFRWQSDWGLILDPLADKLLIGSLAIFLAMFRDFPVWMACMIIGRDLAILAAAVFLFVRPYRLVVPSNRTGKITTAIMSLALLLYLLDIQPYGLWCVWMSLVCIFGSGFHYSWNFIRLLKHQQVIIERSSEDPPEHTPMDAVQRGGTGA